MIGCSGHASGGPFCHHCGKRVHYPLELALPNVIILKSVEERELGLGVYTTPYACDSDTSVILDY